MAEHVWSILCRRAIVDREGGQISIHEVIEKLILENPDQEALEKLEKGFGLLQSMHLVTWWVRSDYSKPETSAFRIVLLTPDGKSEVLGGGQGERPSGPPPKKAMKEFPIDLQKHNAARRVFHLQGLPRWGGFGVYRFVVEGRGKGNRWVTAARIPLEVERRVPAETTH